MTKPTSIRTIQRVLGAGNDLRLAKRWRCAGKAYLVDAQSDEFSSLAWDVYNISPTGAFLETKGPLPIGSELRLLLELGGRRAEITGRVVRVQEPSWLDVGGVGITFVEPSADAVDVLQRAIASAEPGED